MKFLLDESVSHLVTEPPTAAGHDVVHARDVGLRSASDPVVLAAAVEDDRVLITLDTDFGGAHCPLQAPGPERHSLPWKSGAPHAGDDVTTFPTTFAVSPTH